MPSQPHALATGHDEAKAFARKHGLDHEHSRRELAHHWDSYPFGTGTWRRARNVVRGAIHGRAVTAFEYRYALMSDSVEDNGYGRDAANRFLVCVIDLDHTVPDLVAVRSEWFAWHADELPGAILPVDHPQWNAVFTHLGVNQKFASAVVGTDFAHRCAEADLHAEWRFAADELLLWVKGGRVGDQLVKLVEIAIPLVEAAERYRDGAAGTRGPIEGGAR